MNKDKCLCKPTEILIFPCSGGSNVGQISNESAKGLTELQFGKMYCLAGVGGHVNGIIESTKKAKKIVAIDGCPVHCVRKTLEHAGFKPDVHVIVTEQGIEKNGSLDIKQDNVDKVIQKVKGDVIEQ